VRGPGANLKTQYAVQTVIYLARQQRGGVAPVPEIAEVVGISPKFLEDILAALRAAGIVQSRRGKEGGYQLVPSPAELTVLDVVQALEGPMPAATREDGSGPARATALVFDRALAAAAALLGQLTIDDLMETARRLDAEHPSSYMYYL
jgi:Rrf2 family cysteine metabolism transcriptional repressor